MTHRNNAALKARLLGTAALVAALWTVSAPAFAAIETVTVTAERRVQSLDTVSGAVSALGSDRIETQRIQNFDDITQQMPSVSFRSPSPDSGFLSIRGSIASSDGPGQDNGASVYVDDIYANGPGDLPGDYFDLDRIEVLRGPQGTLFGRNVTGGLIAFYTKPPSFDPGFGVELTGGDYALWQGSAYVNQPLSDTVAVRLNAYGMQRDGYSTSARDPSNSVGDQKVWSVRGQILFRPNDKFSARLGIEHTKNDSEGPANSMLGDAPFFGDNPVPGTLASYSPKITNTFEDGFFRKEATNAFLHMDWDAGFATLTSITGYRNERESMETISFADPGTTLGFLPDPLPIYVISLDPPEKDRLWTEEVRLTSPSDQPFTWITGFYYIDSTRSRTEAVNAGLLSLLLAGGAPTAQSQDVTLHGWSVFADGTYNFTDQFSIAAGARYTHETKSGMTTKNGFFTASGLTESATYSGSWDSITPRVVLSYKPDEDWLIYALASRGFKGGGFDFGGDTAATFDDPYQPEHVWNYEAGLRGRLFDEHVSVAANVYRQNYTNLQLRVTSFVGGVPTSETSNAGKAYAEGLELELQANATDWLTFGGNAAFQHAVLTDYAAGGAILHDIPTPSTPAQAYTLYSTVNLPLPEEDGGLKLDASITHKGRVWLGATDPFTGAPNTVAEVPLVHDKTGIDSLIDASLTWSSPNKRFEIQLWGKNLTDERTVDFGFNWQPLAAAFYGYGGSEFFLVSYSDPRTFGLTLRYRQ